MALAEIGAQRLQEPGTLALQAELRTAAEFDVLHTPGTSLVETGTPRVRLHKGLRSSGRDLNQTLQLWEPFHI